MDYSKKFNILVVKDKENYNGDEIKPQWALTTFKELSLGNNIVVFLSPMNVDLNSMIDAGDTEPIESNYAINFLVELYDDNDLEKAILYQRLFVRCLYDNLIQYVNYDLELDGDDILVKGVEHKHNKLSVSIATVGLTTMKFHLGVNISDNKYIGLYDILINEVDINETNISEIINDIINDSISDFINEYDNIHTAKCKTNVMMYMG